MPQITAIFWVVKILTTGMGETTSDFLVHQIDPPIAVALGLASTALALIFAAWHLTEGTLSIHSINTKRREAFYWATVLATFALGMAAGDMTATSLELGFLGSGVMFAGITLVPLLAWWRFGLPEIPAFWFAYIVTRPLGASFADWMGVSHERSGLDWGTGPVSLSLGVLIVGFVGYIAFKRTGTPSGYAGDS